MRALSLLAAALLFSACNEKEPEAPPVADTDTDVIVDTDTDVPVDTDTDPPLVLTEICNDAEDNDNDQLQDCADPDCQSTCDADYDGAVTDALGGPDCDDRNPTVYEGAQEICDGIDNDCDELADDLDDDAVASTGLAQWRDGDMDGYGGQQAGGCLLLPGNVENGDDCDDGEPAINPGVAEVCDRIDNDCDVAIDELDPGIDPALLTTFWVDFDKDSFGDPNQPVDTCFQGRNATNPDDCDDMDPAVGACK